jgi:hypothetical protein
MKQIYYTSNYIIVYQNIKRQIFIISYIYNENDFLYINLSNSYKILYNPEFEGKKFGNYWNTPNLYYF